ncbi:MULTISPECIES: tenascin-X [Myxococcus]|uniref:Tenascin-X n=1 Tax=Myxococcus llanfairpwllgwyngyllgogerychwyrndrobwllllantysiliogogogochensis TaxID=2590453 RepID=A0A540X213_9BACT|nr:MULTISPECIES: tenascin-X [Myxococcus]NTX07549.1 tenascin-X [Myxococcus sp. CA040A]NTX10774.1 tenascin-X [Myxococcus sp. CA056]NTX55217.1 tenascin-X [Myxococcus sp. CA039A]TQF15286.1 tenascin-X [Myxococcus llanfairpwllgwyngyllgogerychwyrndrobwllllantysiliogogogochensis]
MKSRLLVVVASLTLGLFSACGESSPDSRVMEPGQVEAGLEQCPCGGSWPWCEPCAYICGDNFCDTAHGESSSTCPEDCASVPTCGDGLCNNGETTWSCPSDCPGTSCGDGICNGGETTSTCPGDCPSNSCGDGLCNNGEHGWSCPIDCPNTPPCGDFICSTGEPTWCPQDCPPMCSTCPQEPQG